MGGPAQMLGAHAEAAPLEHNAEDTEKLLRIVALQRGIQLDFIANQSGGRPPLMRRTINDQESVRLAFAPQAT